MKNPSVAPPGRSISEAPLEALAREALRQILNELNELGISGTGPIPISYPSRTMTLMAQACVVFFGMAPAARHNRDAKVSILAEALVSIKAGCPTVSGDQLAAMVFDGLIAPDYMNAWGDFLSR